ncbi:MAG TPA: PaaI family thioesterase [Acidobacteriota bacterium]|nr:PaaI family thioesterase [Acidobacteriota bacterium]
MPSARNPESTPSGWSPTRGRKLRALFVTVPYPKHLGMRLGRLAAGEAHISLTGGGDLRQYQGITHGGALASLADTAATLAAMTILPGGLDVVTVEFKVNFVRALTRGRATAVGTVVHMGGRTTIAEVRVHGRAKTDLLATGTFTMLNVPIP